MAMLGSSSPGAGMLKGSLFLLYNDWKILSDRPELDMYEQTNKARDILIRTESILEMKNKDNQYDKELQALWDELSNLMGSIYNFSAIEGAQDWKNEYWKELSHLLAGLYKLNAKEELIETEGSQDMRAPFSLNGGQNAG
jgi:hypothetical protein